MNMLPTQKEIDLYYEKKKKEVATWIMEYTNGLKRLTKMQKATIVEYADKLSFSNIGDLNLYVQGLNTVSKRDKNRFFEYLRNIDWMPDGVHSGFLDGQYVVKVLPNELDLLLEEIERKK